MFESSVTMALTNSPLESTRDECMYYYHFYQTNY